MLMQSFALWLTVQPLGLPQPALVLVEAPAEERQVILRAAVEGRGGTRSTGCARWMVLACITR